MTDEISKLHQWQQGWVCPKCKMARGSDGHDPCLGKLPGVMFACCGHGGNGNCLGYIYFENGVRIGFNGRFVEVKRDA